VIFYSKGVKLVNVFFEVMNEKMFSKEFSGQEGNAESPCQILTKVGNALFSNQLAD
jgi:hypothetical protein